MKSNIAYVIVFKSRSRFFVEIPEDIVSRGRIFAGEPLELELDGDHIIYRKMAGPARYDSGRKDVPAASQTKDGTSPVMSL
jgi:hypothetical protein